MTFPDALGGGQFVLCSSCTNENWDQQEQAATEGLKKLKAMLDADPTNEGLLLTQELLEATLELFDSKDGDHFDKSRWNAAMKRLV